MFLSFTPGLFEKNGLKYIADNFSDIKISFMCFGIDFGFFFENIVIWSFLGGIDLKSQKFS